MKYGIRLKPYFIELNSQVYGTPEIGKVLIPNDSDDEDAEVESTVGLTLEIEALDYANKVIISPTKLQQFMKDSLQLDPEKNDMSPAKSINDDDKSEEDGKTIIENRVPRFRVEQPTLDTYEFCKDE